MQVFCSGFIASGFSPGTNLGGKGKVGFILRTTIASITSGLISKKTGGKFANGAISSAFQHMFNDEMSNEKLFDYEEWAKRVDPPLEDSSFMFIPTGKILSRFKVDWYSSRNGRILGLRYKSEGLIRIDYHGFSSRMNKQLNLNNFSKDRKYLHYHRFPDMKKHRPYEK